MPQTSSQPSPIGLYTSVLGTSDYRYSDNSPLVLDDGLQIAFAVSPIPSQGLSPANNADFIASFNASTGVTSSVWNANLSSAALGSFQFASNISVVTDSAINSKETIVTALPALSNPFSPVPIPTVNSIWIMIKYLSDGVILQLLTNSGSSNLNILAGVFFIDGISIANTPLQTNQWYIIEWWYSAGNGGCNIWDVNQPLVQQNYGAGVASNTHASATRLNLGSNMSGSANYYVTDVIVYAAELSIQDQQTNLNYFADSYQTLYALPFVWPVGSYSQPN